MSPSKRIALLGRRGRLENRAAGDQLRLLKQFRRQILAELASSSAGRALRLNQMLSVVDREILRGVQAAQGLAVTSARAAAALGATFADVAGPAGLYALSPELLSAAVSVTTDALRGIWAEVGSRLKLAIRRVALGLDDPFGAMVRVARMLRDRATFASTFARAEAIVRTETNRTFSLANAERLRQGDARLAATGQRLLKWWLDVGDDRVRDWHAQAGRDYTSATAIPIERPFVVGGEELMYPLDPSASAANTVHCRCVMLTRVVSAAEFARLYPRAA